MTLIIAGERSGVGKTTITLSILAFLARQKNIVQGFKVGPDYIDPMFHTSITGRYSRNLDPVLTSPDYVRSCFAIHSSTAYYAVIEGVMGLFDGVQLHSESNYGSTAHIARLLDIPVLLVLDCSRLSGSIAAIAHGFRSFDPQIHIVGVVLNRVASDRHLELLEDALNDIKMPILGVVRRYDEITIPDRHLGLVPTAELPEIEQIHERLAHIAQTAFDWDKLLPLLRANINYGRGDSRIAPTTNKPLKIAIAYDRAFNFYYQDNFDILRQLGAELVFWSPLADYSVPEDVAGFYFGGGFPEMLAEELAANTRVKQQLQKLIAQNLPVYAECGGLMYLCDLLIDLQGKIWDMVGVIPTTATMTPCLTLGYRQVFPLNNSLLSQSFSPIWGHEFHRSKLTAIAREITGRSAFRGNFETTPTQPLWHIKSCSPHSKKVAEGWQIENVSASYIHLHFGESQNLLKNWLNCCRDSKNQLL